MEKVILIMSTSLITMGIVLCVKNSKKKKINEMNILNEINIFNEDIIKLRNEYFTYTDEINIKNKFNELYKKIKNRKVSYRNKKIFNDFIRDYDILDELRANWNKEYVKNELIINEGLLSNIDGKSLDDQQRLAVVTDEDNNLVIAGAGSGKTLTISAKVKYLVDRKKIDPQDILLISFTSKSAQEMYERIYKKLDIKVEVKTFHKLGLDIIKKSREYRPDIAEEDFLNKIIKRYFKEIIFNDKEMIHKFINFLTYYFNVPEDIEAFDNLGEYYDSYKHLDLETIKGKLQSIKNEINELKANYKSIQGEKVKSLEEVNIANFLFLNGIEYIYEYKYPFEQEDKYRKQYRPDFYLPKYDIYIEHFGITKDNRVPWLSEFEEKKYLDGINWKRRIHEKNETELIETYSYYSKEGILLKKLKEKLENKSVEFNEVNFQEIYEKIYSEKDDNLVDLIKLISTFINLYKSNGYDEKNFEDIKKKIKKFESRFSRKRAEMFIDITKVIYLEYQKALTDLGYIDFNDMINEATKLIKNKNLELNYKYIIVDEYQDISMSRFNLIKEIKNITNAKLLCVGDDWQSIYRFTGSDINLFTKFGDFVGYYELLKIEKTYRNSQQLIDVASKFITKNTNQINKNLKSDKQLMKPIKIIGYSGYNAINEIDSLIEEIVAENGVNTDITILARNNKDILRLYDVRDNKNISELSEGILNIKNLKNEIKITCSKYPNLNINYMTVHRSKGLEGENVIVINLENRVSGFPNKFIDDKLIALLLSNNEDYPYSEERRLFYVALTRTKNKTYLLTKIQEKSIFISELINDFNIELEVLDKENTILDNPRCPICITGIMVLRESKDGKQKFLGCNNYPRCNSTLSSIEIIDDQIKCTKCGSYMIRKSGAYGEFYGCSNYNNGCRNTLSIKIVEDSKVQSINANPKIERSEKHNKSDCEENILLPSSEIQIYTDFIEKNESDYDKVKNEELVIDSKNNGRNVDKIEEKEKSKNKKTLLQENKVINNEINIIDDPKYTSQNNKKDVSKVEQNKNKREKHNKLNKVICEESILSKNNENSISTNSIKKEDITKFKSEKLIIDNENNSIKVNEIKEKDKVTLLNEGKPKKNESNIIDQKSNNIKSKKNDIVKASSNKKSGNKNYGSGKLLFSIGDKVNHSLYGDGEIIYVDKQLIKVMFKAGYVQFSYMTCIEDMILKKIDITKQKNDNELIKLSEELSSKSIYNKLALETNLKIIRNGNKNEKYYFRVAKCYKSINRLDEAVEIYKKILIINPESKVAREELRICKELRGLGKYQNPHEKVYHGYYGDGIYQDTEK